MNALLDTHAFLWWVTNHPQLSTRASEVIADGENTTYLSIAIKAGLGKLRLPADPAPFIKRQLTLNASEVLPIDLNHALHVFGLPALHRDPFDRILVAQSQVEALTIITADEIIGRYDVRTLW
jgi:PIN domain nuclease of toxin-antitoxin system